MLKKEMVFLKFENQYYIVFNDSIHHLGRIRFNITHEIGHILLGHVDAIPFYRKSEFDSETNEQETQANIFARDLLMPSAILTALEVHTPEKISTLCNISVQSAQIRAKRMEILYHNFQLHPLERTVTEQFLSILMKEICENKLPPEA
ncbi:ImmA/IrrE family metallo-endopeptidase [Anaerotignum sp.]|uniref:ImmA/IrrE family metallo-endopeptidase n=1 Tax=Anaerotignum sp. TaxID=2039241 RepID=UPI002714B2B8|nr:ImmA/IrrE family metallo-endopeptidase [Anaerotignum sp.]